MADEDTFQVQGDYVSNAEFAVDLSPWGGPVFKTRDFQGFEWDDGVEGEKVEGFGMDPLGRTVGDRDSNASMTMLYASSVRFQNALKKIAKQRGSKNPQRDMYLIPFDITGKWTPILEGDDAPVHTVQITGARLQKGSVKVATGAGAIAKEMPLSVMAVEEDNGEEI